MTSRFALALFVFFDLLFLLLMAPSLGIGPSEARIFYSGEGLLFWIVSISTKLFGQSELGLRLPFVLLHGAALVLLYQVSKEYVKKPEDRLLSIALYAFLPGVNSAALLVNEAGIVIVLTLFFLLLYERGSFWGHALLPALVFVDNSFAVLFFALIFYAVHKRDTPLLVESLLLFAISMYLFGFDTSGKPKGYFMDTLGVYAAVFSPLLFIYFFYAIYRILIKEQKRLLWFISSTALFFSLLLSFRQKVRVEEFAPFLVIAVPLMVSVFMHSYRIRLASYRLKHRVLFGLVAISLAANTVVTFFNKPLYLVLDDPRKHFAYPFHLAKELASGLKAMGVQSVKVKDPALQGQLRFYGIEEGGPLLTKSPVGEGAKKVSIFYTNREIGRFFVSNLNK